MALLTRTAWFVCLFCGWVSLDAPAAAQRLAPEQDVKAAFLYNFTRFVTWPDGLPAGEEPFRLCVVADPATTRAVQQTMAGERVDGRPVETVIPTSPDQAGRCQVLFVGRDAEARGRPLLDSVRNQPVLTVGERRGFAESGDGIIEFVMERGRVRFDINPALAERTGLKVSSRLLSVARHRVPDK